MRNDFFRVGSCFSFQIAIYLKSGKALRFTANGASPETGPNEYFDGKAYITLSPKELGTCEEMDSFIQCLCDGVCDGDRPIFTIAQPRRDAWGVLRDPRKFIDSIENEVWSMNDIDFIEVIGEADYDDGIGFGKCCLQYYRYDMDSERFDGIVYGDPMDIKYSAGELNICTVGCKIRRAKNCSDFMNNIKYADNDDIVDETFDFDSPADITGFNSIDLAPFGQFADFDDDEDGEDINELFAAAAQAEQYRPKRWFTQMFGAVPVYEEEEQFTNARSPWWEQYTTDNYGKYEEDNNMMFKTFTEDNFTLDNDIMLDESGISDENGPELEELFKRFAYDDDEDGEDINELFEQYEEYDNYFDDIDEFLANSYADASMPYFTAMSL